MLIFSEDYRFGTISGIKKIRKIFQLFFRKNEQELIRNKAMEDSYLLRVHLFCSTKKEYTGILKSNIKD